MSRHTPHLALRLAEGPADVRAAQALRHRVFVEELGARGGADGLERDAFDERCRHLLLLDALRGRGLPDEVLAGAPKGYTDAVLDDEFPLSMFFEALEKKMRPVISSTVGIRGTDD